MITYPVATLSIPRSNTELGDYASSVHDHMSKNSATFPNPNPTLVVFATSISEFRDAQVKVGTNAKGAASVRNAKRRKLIADLWHLRDYVQGVVELQTTREAGLAVIEGAFLSVRKVGKRSVSDIRVRYGKSPGSVIAEAKAVADAATYYWQYSLDQQVWTSVPEVMRCKLTITGLTPARTYYFRFRALTREGEVGYSQVVSILVH